MNRVYLLFFILILFIAESYLNLVSVQVEEVDLILILSLFFPFYKPKDFVFFLKKNSFMVGTFFFLFLLNIWSSYINYNQDLIFSLKSGRFLLIYIFLAFVVYLFVEYHQQENYIPVIIPLIAIALNFYSYLTNDFSIYTQELKILERYGDVRFMIAGTSVIYLSIYFFNRIENKGRNLYIFLFLLAIIVLIGKTRGIILGLFLVILFSKKIRNILSNSKALKFAFAGVVPLLFFFGNSIFHSVDLLLNSTITDLNSSNNNIQIRFIAFRYYWDILSQSPFSLVFGNGVISAFTADRFQENLYLSDLGVFKIIFNHGILGFLLILRLLIKPIINAKKSVQSHRYGIFYKDYRLFLLFQLFTIISLTFFYHPLGMIYFFLVYFQLKKNELTYYGAVESDSYQILED